MRKKNFGRHFKRTTNQRKGLFRSLMNSLILNERIKTTEAKAKSIKSEVEKLVTKAKNDGEAGKNILLSHLPNEDVVNKLIAEIAPRFKERPGGYTRILRLEKRLKDNSQMVLIEWVEKGTAIVNPVNPNKRVKKAKTIKEPKKEEEPKKETKKKETKKEKK